MQTKILSHRTGTITERNPDDIICNNYCDNTFSGKSCETRSRSKESLVACSCRGDIRNGKKTHGRYLGGCRYWRGNPGGQQSECEQRCDEAMYDVQTETNKCKTGCQINGIVFK